MIKAYCIYCRGVQLVPEENHAKCPSCGGRYSINIATRPYAFDPDFVDCGRCVENESTCFGRMTVGGTCAWFNPMIVQEEVR